jgi:hypothetical protein
MAIVSNIHTPTPPFAGRRWSTRAYPGDLAQTSWVRADLGTVTWAEFTLPEHTTTGEAAQ